MPFVLPDLCDAHPDVVSVLAPGFHTFGGRSAYYGPIRTIRCFEDNSLVAERLSEPGEGSVLVVDGGGSMRCALLGDNLASNGVNNGWAGVVIYGCVRDVDELKTMDLGVHALGSHPMRSVKRGGGERDVVLHFGGLHLHNDQYLYADNNGIAIAPLALPLD